MKSFKIILAIAISFTVFSCKKDNLDSGCQITSITTNNNAAQKATITYDSQNRITEFKNADAKYKFTYNGLTGTMQVFLADTLYRTDDLTFDNSGRLTSYEEYFQFGADLLRYYYLFTYNSDGYLFTTVQTLVGGPYDSYYKDSLLYTNGNLTKKITKYVNGTTARTIDYTYGSTINKTWNHYWNAFTEPFSILSGYTFLYPLLGKPSANLPSSIVVTEGSFVDNFSYDYSLNSDGFVSEYNEMRSNTSTGNTTTNYKFTYNCN